MRILVLDGNQNSAVACVRSLARAGHAPYVGSSCPVAKAAWSRDCRGAFSYPGRQQDDEAFVRCIASEVRREPGALVLPLSDKTFLPLSAHRNAIFEVGGQLIMPPHATVVRAMDKLEMTKLAQSLGVAVPQSTIFSTLKVTPEQVEGLPYPVVLKPRASEEVSASGVLVKTGPPRYAKNPEECIAAFERLRRKCSAVLVQEFVQGAGAGYFALFREGELRVEFAHRRIRDVQPTGSGSAVRVSTLPDPRLRESGLAILHALQWHGVAMVEFRIRPDGAPVFLEVNGRFWNSLALAISSGVDFPALLAEMLERGDVSGPASYRSGTRCRWLLGDFLHLVQVWRGTPPGYPAVFPGRLRALAEFFTPVPRTHHDNFLWRDPLPEVADWLDFAVRRLPEIFARHDSNSPARSEVHA